MSGMTAQQSHIHTCALSTQARAESYLRHERVDNEHDGQRAGDGAAAEHEQQLLQHAAPALAGLAAHHVDGGLALGAALLI